MRRLALFLFAFTLVGIATVPSGIRAQSPAVCFYEHVDFQGRSYCIRVGERIGFVGEDVNDQFSSVRIPPGALVTICEHANFQGRCQRLSHSEPDFVALGFNDMVSAVDSRWDRDSRGWDNRRDGEWGRRPGGGYRHDGYDGGRRSDVCFYEHANYQGRRYCAPIGAAVPSVGPSFNDIFSSVQMPPGVTVTVCRDDNFEGPCRSYRGNVGFFTGSWNDNISSFRSQ